MPPSSRPSSKTAIPTKPPWPPWTWWFSHLGEGNSGEVRVLAAEMVAVFREHNVPREAFAAILLFQVAAHREAATVELAREVAASISRARGGAALG